MLLSGAHRLALLEALLAVDGPSLGRLEGARGLLPTLRAGRHRLDPLPGRLAHPGVPLRLALIATLGLVLEFLVVVEELFARGPDEALMARDAHQSLVSVLHGLSSSGLRPAPAPRGLLFAFATDLLAAPLAGQCLLGPALVAGLQVEAVLLDVLDDVLLLDLPLEAPEGVLDRLALLDLDLGQNAYTP